MHCKTRGSRGHVALWTGLMIGSFLPVAVLATTPPSPRSTPAENRPATALIEQVRTAPWQAARNESAPEEPALADHAYWVGTWITTEPSGEGPERHRTRIDCQSELDGNAVRCVSYRVHEDGREVLYLVDTTFFHPVRQQNVGVLLFDTGMYADAVWIDEGHGVERLDCDLYLPGGRTGAVRDIFVRDGESIHWRMYWVRNGTPDSEPSFEATLVRETATTGSL